MLSRRDAIKLLGAGAIGALADIQIPLLPSIGGSTGVTESDISWNGWRLAQDSLVIAQQGLWGVRYRQGKQWTDGYYYVPITVHTDDLLAYMDRELREAKVDEVLCRIRHRMKHDTQKPGMFYAISGYEYSDAGEVLKVKKNWIPVDEIRWVFRGQRNAHWQGYDKVFNSTFGVTR